MNFHWTRENAFPGWTLRDAKGLARGVVTANVRDKRFYGQIFQPDLPASEGFAGPRAAAGWVMNQLRQVEAVANTEFGDFKP